MPARTLRNSQQSQAVLHAVCLFLDWCDPHGLELGTIEPIFVAASVEFHPGSFPTGKQHMAAIIGFSYIIIARLPAGLSIRTPFMNT